MAFLGVGTGALAPISRLRAAGITLVTTAEPLQADNRHYMIDGTSAHSRIRLVKWESAGQWVFPNPASGPAYLSDPDKIARVALTDMSGRLLRDVPSGGELNIRNMPGGMYLLKVTRKDGSEATSRFVLRK